MKKKVKKLVIPAIYSCATLLVAGGIFLVQNSLSAPTFNDNKEKTPDNYVTETVEENKPVVATTEKVLVKPYTQESVKIGKYFYDYQDEANKQVSSIIYHEGTYMQNSGVDYTSDEIFDVVAVLDGTVINVTEDKLLGKVIEVRHDNDTVSVYQSLSETTVKKDDKVTQGQVIGKSGTNNLAKELNNHLHFELYKKGQVVDPEKFYDKKVSEI